MKKKVPSISFLVLWFPHSGGRWLNRGMLARHSKINMVEFFNPFLLLTTDQILRLDSTEQVHKHRSNSEMNSAFEIVRQSVDYGRQEGLKRYFYTKSLLEQSSMGETCILGGALPSGANIAHFDTNLLSEYLVKTRFIHLVRSPSDCYKSFLKRKELDGDPYRIGSYWLRFNQHLRETLPEDRTLIVKYEDLKENTENELAKICEFCHIEYEAAMLNGIDSYYGIKEKKTVYLDSTAHDILDKLTATEKPYYGY